MILNILFLIGLYFFVFIGTRYILSNTNGPFRYCHTVKMQWLVRMFALSTVLMAARFLPW
jgi:hypothetical protein